jgi:hypothetical protein
VFVGGTLAMMLRDIFFKPAVLTRGNYAEAYFGDEAEDTWDFNYWIY